MYMCIINMLNEFKPRFSTGDQFVCRVYTLTFYYTKKVLKMYKRLEAVIAIEKFFWRTSKRFTKQFSCKQ